MLRDREQNSVDLATNKIERRKGLLKPSLCGNVASKCSTWLNHNALSEVGDTSKRKNSTPVTWSETYYKVNIKSDSVDLVCTRHKYHQILPKATNYIPPGPVKNLQVFGGENTQPNSFSRNPQVEGEEASTYSASRRGSSFPTARDNQHTFLLSDQANTQPPADEPAAAPTVSWHRAGAAAAGPCPATAAAVAAAVSRGSGGRNPGAPVTSTPYR